MAWDIRKNGTTSIGDSVLPGLTAVRGMAAGRTGVLPWAGRLSLVADDLVLAIGDQVELLRNTDVEWTGDVRRLSQAVDRKVNAIRWRIGAEGRIAQDRSCRGRRVDGTIRRHQHRRRHQAHTERNRNPRD